MTTKADPAVILAASRALYGHGQRIGRTDNHNGKQIGEGLRAVATATELGIQYPRLATRQIIVAVGIGRHYLPQFAYDTPIGHSLRVCLAYLESR